MIRFTRSTWPLSRDTPIITAICSVPSNDTIITEIREGERDRAPIRYDASRIIKDLLHRCKLIYYFFGIRSLVRYNHTNFEKPSTIINKYLYKYLDVLVIGSKWSRWYVFNDTSPLEIDFNSLSFLPFFFSDNIHGT